MFSYKTLRSSYRTDIVWIAKRRAYDISQTIELFERITLTVTESYIGCIRYTLFYVSIRYRLSFRRVQDRCNVFPSRFRCSLKIGKKRREKEYEIPRWNNTSRLFIDKTRKRIRRFSSTVERGSSEEKTKKEKKKRKKWPKFERIDALRYKRFLVGNVRSFSSRSRVERSLIFLATFRFSCANENSRWVIARGRHPRSVSYV